MWIERLEIAGFKRLAGSYQFDPGLTVVVGPNEAGKSSLGEALVRSVWGFSRSDRRRREDVSDWERCRPWNGQPWRTVATIVDHGGRRLRAEWDFAEHTLRLLDAVTGDDLSAHVGQARRCIAGPYIAGISADDFWQVCAFDQHTLSEVQRSDSLVNALQRSVESVETEVGVSDADSRLREFLNSQIGARSDSYRPLPAGPLQRDRNERDRLAAQIEDAEQDAAEIASSRRTCVGDSSSRPCSRRRGSRSSVGFSCMRLQKPTRSAMRRRDSRTSLQPRPMAPLPMSDSSSKPASTSARSIRPLGRSATRTPRTARRR